MIFISSYSFSDDIILVGIYVFEFNNGMHIVLPIGISFYTFQIISYLVDIYRKETKAQRNIISLATYIAMFPQLIAGPIVRYTDIRGQLENRKSTVAMLESGICRFIIGLSKKVLLANELGALCEIFRASGEKSVLYYWMYAVAFTLHIYFDFWFNSSNFYT